MQPRAERKTAAAPVQDSGAAAGASASAATASLVNVAVGAGILSMPYAYSLTGWALGLGLTVAVAAIEAATLLVLCRAAEEEGASSYAGLVGSTLGAGASVALASLLYVYLLLSCTGYLMIASDCLGPLLAAGTGADSGAWWASRPAVVTAVGLGAALPLSMPRTLGAIAGVSKLKVWAILFVVGAVVWRSAERAAAPGFSWDAVHASALGGGDAFPPGAAATGLAIALPILAFGFQCHTAAVDLFAELEDAPSAQGGRKAYSSSTASSSSSGRGGGGGGGASGSGGGMSSKLSSMAGVGAVSMGAMAAFYAVMGVSGCVVGATDSNVMNAFPADDPLMQVARAFVGLIVIAAFPANHVPARSTLLDLVARMGSSGGGGGGGGAEALPPAAWTAETVGFCALTTAIAVSVTDLGALFQLTGGMAASVLIFGIPGALLLREAAARGAADGGGGQRGSGAGGLWAAGAALELLTVASWAATLSTLQPGR